MTIINCKKNFNKIYKILKNKKNKNIFLTGGKSIIELYSFLKKKKYFETKNNFFLTDERIVIPKNIKKTNTYLLKKKLSISFKNFEDLYLYNKFKPQKFINKISKRNFNIDYLFLSFGSDGHIASLFRINKDIKKNYRYTKSINHEFRRFTVSEKMISKSKNTFLIIKDEKRYKLFKEMRLKSNLLPISILENYFLVLLF